MKYTIPCSRTLVKFGVVSMLSFVIDFVIFIGLHYFLQQVFLPLFLARIISGSFNFWQNKYRVYRAPCKRRVPIEIVQYVLLAVVVFFAAYGGIHYLLQHAHWHVIYAKLLVDGLGVLISYLVQSYFVFRVKSN